MKIYLAGKIGKGDWRHGIVDGLRDATSRVDRPWQPLAGAIFGRHDYAGPFFVGCDHGCAHGPDSHGIGADGAGSCLMPVFTREEVVTRCLAAILNANLVFAWLDASDAHGTLIEIGYAMGSCHHVVIAMPPEFHDVWFAEHLPSGEGPSPTRSVEVIRTNDPREALRDWLARSDALDACESPIETRLGVALGNRGIRCVPQHPTEGYRLDFAVVSEGVRIAIECDGHDFHERTKEQAAHDRRRDRALTAAGWIVMRFTGSEIHADADSCAREVARMIATRTA